MGLKNPFQLSNMELDASSGIAVVLPYKAITDGYIKINVVPGGYGWSSLSIDDITFFSSKNTGSGSGDNVFTAFIGRGQTAKADYGYSKAFFYPCRGAIQ